MRVRVSSSKGNENEGPVVLRKLRKQRGVKQNAVDESIRKGEGLFGIHVCHEETYLRPWRRAVHHAGAESPVSALSSCRVRAPGCAAVRGSVSLR